MEKLNLHSPDFIEANIAKLVELFPNCVTEARESDGTIKKAIDFDQLRQELSSSIVEGAQERYQLNWPGKREALLTANAPIAKTLRPCREESVDFDSTQNLFIEGDNLDALKLLQETYLGKVKMIYIDPPYNTGNDFIYHDKFSTEKNIFDLQSGLKDDEGNRLIDQEAYRQNSESNGRFHSDWLSMMYPRLKLARNLLRDDGVIFISIDDNEHANLKRMCDEVFGESNFIANAIWRSKDNSNNDAKRFSIDHNHTLIYAKESTWQPKKLQDVSKQGHFKNPDTDPRGPYFDGNPLNSPNYRENLIYNLISPSGNIISPPKNGWRWSKDMMDEKIKSGEIKFTEDEKSIRRRTYLSDMQGLPPSTLWIDLDKTGHNRQAKYELLKLIPEDLFQTPKPVKLIKFMLDLVDPVENDIVMDFFAGSATTAHAIMQLNAEDGGKRKFIMVQLPEICDGKSEAYKAGYKTIAEIGKERIRRAGRKIKDELGRLKDEKKQDSSSFSPRPSSLDTGFRVLKIDSSNMKDVYYTPDKVDQNSLFNWVDNIREDRTAEDLLFQVLLDWGVDLTLPITQEVIAGKSVLFVDDNALAACFDEAINEDFVKVLAARQPLRIVFRDSGFSNDSVKINIEQIFKALSPSTEIKVI